MKSKDSDTYRSIGAWTMSTRSSVKISQMANATYKFNVVRDRVAVDKHDRNVGNNNHSVSPASRPAPASSIQATPTSTTRPSSAPMISG